MGENYVKDYVVRGELQTVRLNENYEDLDAIEAQNWIQEHTITKQEIVGENITIKVRKLVLGENYVEK